MRCGYMAACCTLICTYDHTQLSSLSTTLLTTSWKEVVVESHIELALTSIVHGLQPMARALRGSAVLTELLLGRVARDARLPYLRN